MAADVASPILLPKLLGVRVDNPHAAVAQLGGEVVVVLEFVQAGSVRSDPDLDVPGSATQCPDSDGNVEEPLEPRCGEFVGDLVGVIILRHLRPPHSRVSFGHLNAIQSARRSSLAATRRRT